MIVHASAQALKRKQKEICSYLMFEYTIGHYKIAANINTKKDGERKVEKGNKRHNKESFMKYTN
jgi:hypothetical protein